MTLRTKDATQNEQLALLLAWHGHNCRSILVHYYMEASKPTYYDRPVLMC